MKTTAIKRVSFGSAKALTQQDIKGDYLEQTFQPAASPWREPGRAAAQAVAQT